MKVHIIDDNAKGVGPNFSLRPISDCLNCSGCSEECYDRKAYRMYPGVRTARDENSYMAHEEPEELFQQIREYLASHNTRSFRIHVGGDFISQEYLNRWISVANDFPHIAFLAFTKVYWLDYSKRPANLQIVFSIWPGMPAPKRQAGIQFAFLDDNSGECSIPDDAIPCLGTCENCGICWFLNRSKHDVFFQVH